MHIPRIHLSQAITEHSTIELEPAAAHHLAKVLRMKSGQSLILFNGITVSDNKNSHCVGEYEATLAYVDKKKVSVAVGQFIEKTTESSFAISLGVSIIKNDRMDWLIQKATELGVTSIAPLWSAYTDVKIPADRLEKKMHHWQQVSINACEQSQRVSVPIIHTPQKIHEWTQTIQADKKWVLHPYTANQAIADSANKNSTTPTSLALLVGPEGGLSDEEVAASMTEGFEIIQLGPRILRAETAPLAAITLCQYRYGDF